MIRLLTTCTCLVLASALLVPLSGCPRTVVPPDTNGDDMPADGDDMPATVILAKSRTGHYVITHPDTGEDIVEVVPDVVSLRTSTLGYQGARVYLLSPATAGTEQVQVYGCDALTGENLVQLTDFDGLHPSDLDGSPVEAKLVFAADGAEDASNIYVMNEDGTDLTQLTFDEETHYLPDGTEVLCTGAFTPSWSPDGTRIVYALGASIVAYADPPHWLIMMMDADGSNKRVLFDQRQGAPYYSQCWLSGGNFIVFSHDDPEDLGARETLAIHVGTLTTSDLTTALTHADLGDVNAIAASPAEMVIVYNYTDSADDPLYIAHLQAAGDTVSVVSGPDLLTVEGVGHRYASPDWAPYVP